MSIEQLAKAITDAFFCPNVIDSDLEPSNLVDVVSRLADEVGDGCKLIAGAIDNLADAIGETKERPLCQRPSRNIARSSSSR